jgi:hypothetical protein
MNFPQVRPDRISEATSVGLAVPRDEYRRV